MACWLTKVEPSKAYWLTLNQAIQYFNTVPKNASADKNKNEGSLTNDRTKHASRDWSQSLIVKDFDAAEELK